MTTRTFDPALTTSKDRMRFALGDTGVNVPKAADADALLLPVDDALYAGALAYRGNDERLALIDMADALIARYAQETTHLETSEWRNRLTAWQQLASRLRAELASEAALALALTRGSFSVARPHRPGPERGAEYYAGGRCPPEGWE